MWSSGIVWQDRSTWPFTPSGFLFLPDAYTLIAQARAGHSFDATQTLRAPDAATTDFIQAAAERGSIHLFFAHGGEMKKVKSAVWNRSKIQIKDWFENCAINECPPNLRGCGRDVFVPIFVDAESLGNQIDTIASAQDRDLQQSAVGALNHFWSDGARKSWPLDSDEHVFLGNAILRLGRSRFPETWRDSGPGLINESLGEPPASGDTPLHDFLSMQFQKRARQAAEGAAVFGEIIAAVKAGDLSLSTSQYQARVHTPCAQSWWIDINWTHLMRRCEIDPDRPQNAYSAGQSMRPLFVDKFGLERLISGATTRDDGADRVIDDTPKLELGASLSPAEIKAATSDSPKRRGRRRVWDWTALMGEITRIADEDGLDRFANQAALERHAKDWFAARHKGEHPAESQIREHVSAIYVAREAHNNAKAE